MGQFGKQVLTVGLLLFLIKTLNGQTQVNIKGVIHQDSTRIKIINATVYNTHSRLIVYTNDLGLFEIPGVKGDTLEVNADGYVKQQVRIVDTYQLTIYLQLSNILSEVVIKGTSTKYTIKEVSTDFSKEKGIFYKGKPPLILLNPFGGKPLTFFHELLGTDAKRVRRLNKLSAQEVVYNEIDSRFNNEVIKRIVPIKEEKLEEFKADYWPKLEELRKWSDYELYNYIKRSFEEFKNK